MDALFGGGNLYGGQNGGQASGGRDYTFSAHGSQMAQQPAVGGHFSLTADALGHVSAGPGVDAGVLRGYLRDGVGDGATVTGAQPHDVS
jgi:hypothetical protein